MARVTFVNRFYWPEEPATSQLLTDLAQALVKAGYEVVVVTSRRDPAAAKHETRHGVQIHRVGLPRHGGRSAFIRIIDFASFIISASGHLLSKARGGDTIVFMTDPPLLGAIATAELEWRDVRIVHWVQDIYPEVAIELTKHRWLRFLIPLRNWAWRTASACATLGRDMAAVISQAGATPTIIPNWAPDGLHESPADESAAIKHTWGVAGKFVALYSGNLGQVHDLHAILDIAEHLKNDTDIVFVIVGHGAQQAALKAAAATRGLRNVTFQPHQPRAQLNASLSAGDLHFVTLKPGCETCVLPSKFHGILAVARPVLFIGPESSEFFSLIPNAKLGLSFTRNNSVQAADAIRRLKDDQIRYRELVASVRHYAQSHGFDASLSAWLNLLGREKTADQG